MRYRRDGQVQWRVSIYDDQITDDKNEKFSNSKISKWKIAITIIYCSIAAFIINFFLHCHENTFTFIAYTTPEARTDIGQINGTTVFNFYKTNKRPLTLSEPLSIYNSMRYLRDSDKFRKTLLHALNQHFSLVSEDLLFIHTNPGQKHDIFELGVTVVRPEETSFEQKLKQLGFSKMSSQEGLFLKSTRQYQRLDLSFEFSEVITDSFRSFLRERDADYFLKDTGKHSIRLMNEADPDLVFYLRSGISSASVEIGFTKRENLHVVFNNAFQWLHEQKEMAKKMAET